MSFHIDCYPPFNYLKSGNQTHHNTVSISQGFVNPHAHDILWPCLALRSHQCSIAPGSWAQLPSWTLKALLPQCPQAIRAQCHCSDCA